MSELFAGRLRHPGRAQCRRYSAGHTPHVIQVRLCHESPADDWLQVVVLGAVGDVLTLADGDRLRRYRNHEAAYLAAVAERVGAEARFNVRYRALFLQPWPDGARSVFHLQDVDDPPLRCVARL